MLHTTVTHSYAWNEPDDIAWCGAPVSEATHSLTPSCPACARALAIEDALKARLAAEAGIALTDDDARYAGVPADDLFVATPVAAPPVATSAPASLADDLFAYAATFNRIAARGGRR